MVQATETATEAQQAAYIRECGERLANTIVDHWLDGGPERLKPALQIALAAKLDACCTEFEVAQWAASLVGNPTFEEWLEDNQ